MEFNILKQYESDISFACDWGSLFLAALKRNLVKKFSRVIKTTCFSVNNETRIRNNYTLRLLKTHCTVLKLV